MKNELGISFGKEKIYRVGGASLVCARPTRQCARRRMVRLWARTKTGERPISRIVANMDRRCAIMQLVSCE